jgi:hypothetical protein
MINYSTWQTKPIRVVDINLDPENPRIPPTPALLSELELIHLFCRHYQTYELAKSIAEDGYFPDERIVVVEKDEKYIVLEGNRRISSLKILNNPDLAPDEMKSKFQKIAETVDKKIISKCDAIVAPNRTVATKLILEKHTQSSVLKWSPVMKAEFYRKLNEQGTSLIDISKQYNLTQSSIQDFLRMSRMYRLAVALELPLDVKELVQDPQNFPISTLERIYNSQEARKILTLSDDLSTISCPPSDFKKAFNQIVTDIATSKQDSRTLDKANDISMYTKNVRDAVGIKDTGIKVSIDSIFPQHQSLSTLSLKKPTPKSTQSTRQTKGLFGASDIPFKLKGASSLHKFYDELKTLPVKTYPNTSAILFRVFVDKASRHFLKRKGIKNISIGRRTKKLADVTFGEILDFLTEKTNTLISDDNIKKAIKAFKSGSSFKSLSFLNSIVHNEELSFTETQARDLVPNIEGLLKVLLSE